jgi:ketosteroid isomerase-like protein
MARRPLPALAATIDFIACVNRTDLPGLTDLLHPDHRLVVLDEPPLVGREANVDAWRGYFAAFPRYVIYPRFLTAVAATEADRVAVLGNTAGSHLDLADEDELQLNVIWIAESDQGLLTLWQICEDTPARRRELAIPEAV